MAWRLSIIVKYVESVKVGRGWERVTIERDIKNVEKENHEREVLTARKLEHSKSEVMQIIVGQ